MKSLLMFRGGVRSATKALNTGKVDAEGKPVTEEHTLYYKARTPNELAAHFGAESAFTNDEAGSVARQKHRAKFIAASMCDEAGQSLMTTAEAELILGSLKAEIVNMIVVGSNESGDAGKD
jgi:hypothetical protein